MAIGGVKRGRIALSVKNEIESESEDLSQAKTALEESIDLYGANKTARDLHQALTFQQDDIKSYCIGLLSLRALLGSVVPPGENVDTTNYIFAIQSLLDLLNHNVTDFRDKDCFGQIVQPWHFALRVNNDYLLSSIASTTVLLLRAFDRIPQFHDHGIRLCRTLLRKPEAKLLSTCLALPKNKAHLISLTTQILTELVSFDAGAVAWTVFAERDYLLDYRILTRNLRIREIQAVKFFSDEVSKSVRTNACLYLLANLRYQSTSAKIHILKLRSLFQALFDGIESNPIDLVRDILYVTKTCIVLDGSLPKYSKSAIWTVMTFKSVINILRTHVTEPEALKKHEENQDLALGLILSACKMPEAGLLVPNTSWHSSEGSVFGKIIDEEADPLQLIEVELYSLDRTIDPTRKIAIKNRMLGEFIMHLRPYANVKECHILLESFIAAPELIAYYFYRNSTLSHEPKLSNTWLGYSSFIHSVTKLPICRLAEGWPPPPIFLVIESILPLPFTQRNFRRCFNHSSPLIRFFAIQYLVSALRKLQQVRNKFISFKDSKFGSVWKKAARQLLIAISQRCPGMRDVITAFKSTPPSSVIQSEAASALVELYFEVIPQAALREHFDISMDLCNALQHDDVDLEPIEGQLRFAKLYRLANVARYSTNVNWFSRPESLSISPFSSLLMYSINFRKQQNVSALLQLLTVILQEHDIFQKDTEPTAFDAIEASLSSLDLHALHTVIPYFDECCMRCVRKPVKYHDDLDEIVFASQITKRKPVSAFWAAIVEQWPFAQNFDPQGSMIIASWISKCIGLCCQIGEDEQVLLAIREAITGSTNDTECRKALLAPFSHRNSQFSENYFRDFRRDSNSAPSSTQHLTAPSITFPYFLPIQPENNNLQGLGRVHEDVEQSIIDGALGELILCLCSKHVEIRKEAFVNIRKVRHKLKSADYSESLQVWLLLSEIEETAKQLIPHKPLPYVIGSFAKSSVVVLANPAHPLYSKVNVFLNNAPFWDLTRFTFYWVDQILLSPPAMDNSYFIETEWLLRILFDGLRTLEDLDLIRNHGPIEHILALFNSPSSPEEQDRLILGILWRIASIGGTTTLITRFGIVSWIKSQAAINRQNRKELFLLANKLDETCDSVKVHDWSLGACSDHLKELSRNINGSDIC